MDSKSLITIGFLTLLIGCRTHQITALPDTTVSSTTPSDATPSVQGLPHTPSGSTVGGAPESPKPPVESSKTVSVQSKKADSEVNPSSDFPWRSVVNGVFGVGERFDFAIKWGIVTAGHSSLAVQDVLDINGRPAFYFVSEARSAGVVDGFYKVRDKNESWVDQQSFTTLRFEKHISEGKYRLEEVTTIDPIKRRFSRYQDRKDKNEQSTDEGDVPTYVLDVFSSLYYVRLMPMEVGKSYVMDVLSGRKVYPLKVNILSREKVKVPAGEFVCFRVEPVLREPGIFISKGRKLEVWITADERRMPVLMRSEVFIGHVAAELTGFTLAPPR